MTICPPASPARGSPESAYVLYGELYNAYLVTLVEIAASKATNVLTRETKPAKVAEVKQQAPKKPQSKVQEPAPGPNAKKQAKINLVNARANLLNARANQLNRGVAPPVAQAPPPKVAPKRKEKVGPVPAKPKPSNLSKRDTAVFDAFDPTKRAAVFFGSAPEGEAPLTATVLNRITGVHWEDCFIYNGEPCTYEMWRARTPYGSIRDSARLHGSVYVPGPSIEGSRAEPTREQMQINQDGSTTTMSFTSVCGIDYHMSTSSSVLELDLDGGAIDTWEAT